MNHSIRGRPDSAQHPVTSYPAPVFRHSRERLRKPSRGTAIACSTPSRPADGTSLSADEIGAPNPRAFAGVEASEVCDATGETAGLAVVLGSQDGRLEVGLAESGQLLVHGLALKQQHAEQAREHIEMKGLCGRVSVERAADGNPVSKDRNVGDGRVYFADHKPGEANETTPRVVGLDIHSGKEAWQADGPHVGDLPHPCFYDEGVLCLTNENGYAGIPITEKGRPWTVPVMGWKDKANYRFRAFSGIGISGYLKVDGLVWIKDRQKIRLGDDPFASEEQKPFKGWIGVDPLTGHVKRQIHYPSTAYWRYAARPIGGATLSMPNAFSLALH